MLFANEQAAIVHSLLLFGNLTFETLKKPHL